MKHLTEALLDALGLALPTHCALCGALDRAICDACTGQLVPSVTPLLVRAREGPPLPMWAALQYSGGVTRALSALKERGRTDVARVLGPILGEAAAAAAAAGAAVPSGVEFTVAPSSRAAYRKRGYHPVELLAKRAGIRVVRTLRATRHVADQAGLGVSGRRENLDCSLATLRRFPEGSLQGRSFVVLDDVVTTGATLLECRRALEHAGAAVPAAVTLAYAERRLGASTVERLPLAEAPGVIRVTSC